MAELPEMEHRCNWSNCTSAETRRFQQGDRCVHHTPAALKGLAEADELLRRGQEVLEEKRCAKEAAAGGSAA
jgi:hypothetical protein